MSEEKELTPEQLQTQFQTLAAEADLYSQKFAYDQAIIRYTAALEIHPDDKNCFVARSRCHLLSGNPTAALADANSALKLDDNFFKAIFMRAEALYSLGDFEYALVNYHRGNKARPEMHEFRVGVQKATEAIENSIGNPKDIKIKSLAKGNFANVRVTPHSSDLAKGFVNKSDSQQHQQQSQSPATSSHPSTPTTFNFNAAPTSLKSSSEKKLLGELYEDKVYLQQLLKDELTSPNPNAEIHESVSEGLSYIDSRIEFWRQQNPLYARPKHHVRYFKLKKNSTGGDKSVEHQEEKLAKATTVKSSKGVAHTGSKQKSAFHA